MCLMNQLSSHIVELSTERDPFLCSSCGYSKYAKFETTVSGKSCAAVDPIENEEDRKKVLYRLVLTADWESHRIRTFCTFT